MENNSKGKELIVLKLCQHLKRTCLLYFSDLNNQPLSLENPQIVLPLALFLTSLPNEEFLLAMYASFARSI